jgi:hypothetical protein
LNLIIPALLNVWELHLSLASLYFRNTIYGIEPGRLSRDVKDESRLVSIAYSCVSLLHRILFLNMNTGRI